MMIEIEILPNNSEEVSIERRATVNVRLFSLSLSCSDELCGERERERADDSCPPLYRHLFIIFATISINHASSVSERTNYTHTKLLK